MNRSMNQNTPQNRRTDLTLCKIAGSDCTEPRIHVQQHVLLCRAAARGPPGERTESRTRSDGPHVVIQLRPIKLLCLPVRSE